VAAVGLAFGAHFVAGLGEQPFHEALHGEPGVFRSVCWPLMVSAATGVAWSRDRAPAGAHCRRRVVPR
jgi:hypothetical protein